MAGKHTAGPWSTRAVDGQVAIDALHATTNWYALATVITAIEDGETGEVTADPEGEANARLIAAAPDLLEALEIAVRQNDHDMLMTGDELRMCRAAIARATQPLPPPNEES